LKQVILNYQKALSNITLGLEAKRKPLSPAERTLFFWLLLTFGRSFVTEKEPHKVIQFTKFITKTMMEQQLASVSSAVGHRKINYHTFTLLAGLLVFFSQLIVLNSSHGDHVRHLQANAGPPISEPCPATVRGSTTGRGSPEKEDSIDKKKVDDKPIVATHPGSQLDFKKEKKLRNDSSDASVIGMAQDYPLDTHRRFVGSLRKSGFAGTIMLATEANMKKGVEEYLRQQNVTILKVNYTECVHKILEDHEVKNKK